MTSTPYNLSFSTGGLFLRESVELASRYLDLEDWGRVREQAVSENLLQTRTQSSAKRAIQEILHRLKVLSHDELCLLVSGSSQDQAQLLWLAVCRYYPFIGDFAREVIRERYLSLRHDLGYEDFEAFVRSKFGAHPELEAIEESTLNKVRQILFRMMREAGILSKDNSLIPAILGPQLHDHIANSNPEEFLIYPSTQLTVKGRQP
jgi:hypothetical protein